MGSGGPQVLSNAGTSMQGRRPKQEDRHVQIPDLHKVRRRRVATVFASPHELTHLCIKY